MTLLGIVVVRRDGDVESLLRDGVRLEVHGKLAGLLPTQCEKKRSESVESRTSGRGPD